jgi:hypothetical protein
MRSRRRRAMGSLGVLLVLALGLLVGTGSPAWAQYVGGTPPQVGAVDNWHATGSHSHDGHGTDGTDGGTGRTNRRASPGGLPMTGGDIVGLCILAVGVSAAGLALTRVGRRPTTAAS